MMSGGMGVFMMLFWIVILGLVIYGIYRLVTTRATKKEDGALSILKEQFARGEISEEEYEKRKRMLTKE
ncbi:MULTISPECIES: SHOCT domain-containing protein [Staphylococcaceae]|jgi:putative membrane protein|uniref:SHOCT domain-containing protein n=1 Tax=Staphylococcaceae TaxID=90964 RepID=UPI00201FCC19|nr:SHOCT domain-containing protein [Jeotgalicoccus sp. WY2]|tara:strand:+ start:172 stop:378 length:207 start_codon:yes stop_codon:yes gene_type:complete